MKVGSKSWRVGAACVAGLVLAGASSLTLAQSPAPAPASGVRYAQITEADTRTWLTYLSSDLLQGRQVFTEGYGLAASYIADQLKLIGVRPLGDNGTYFQSVSRKGYRVARNSSITVEANGSSRTFKHGDHVNFPVQAGSPQTLTFKDVVFAGDGSLPSGTHASDLRGKLVLVIPSTSGGRGGVRRDSPTSRANALVQSAGAAGVITLMPAGSATGTAARGGGRGAVSAPAGSGPAPVRPDFTTLQRVYRPMAPILTADETFFDAAFARASLSLTEARARTGRGEAFPPVVLSTASVTIAIDNTYELLSLELTENVVGMVEGTDPVLKDTYVFFGAHLDHVGYSSGSVPKGQVNTPLEQDRIWNGADDDGSGSSAVLAIAKAFVTGPKPKRSVVFIWHAGEEAGLIGSSYMAENPVVPLDRVQVELNIDMIGRNRDNDPGQSNTVYVIGADRISTDLHNLLVTQNNSQDVPLALDFEYNDVNDPNGFYTRSDHYSYALKGIPIAFFFTGTHPDYHANTDTVDKILFPKLVRIAQYIYEAGFSLANTDRTLLRDNKGSRSGRGFSGLLPR